MKRPTWQRGGDGRRLIVPPPVIRESSIGGTEFTFSIWMERPHGRSFLLQTMSYALNVPVEPLEDPGTAALTAVLLPAMQMGLPIRIEAPVSPRFLEKAGDFQDVFSTWVKDLQRVEIEAPPAPVRPPPAFEARGTGSLFSLGVDGFHTFRRHAEEITDLVFIHGFDIDLDKQAHRMAVQMAVEKVAQELGKRLITVQTNARSFADAYLWWGYYSGSVLGATAQLLAAQLRRIYFASSASYDAQVMFGTNALTDPWLSTEAVEVIHDGTEFSRMGKIMALAQDELALRHLRVCWGMEGTARNCGRCDKCLRTMTALFLAGALDRAPSFPAEIDIEAVRQLRLSVAHRAFLKEHREKAQEMGLEDSPLMLAWQECALRSGEAAGHVLDPTLLRSLTKRDRDQIFADLRQHAPDELCRAAARLAPRMRRDVFEFIWRNARSSLWKAVRKSRI